MKNLFFGTLALALSAVAHAGPFGLDMGSPMTALSKQMKLTPTQNHFYSTPTVPKSHPDFDDYRLMITPSHGLCKINAWTKVITTSIYGSELRGKFNSLQEALEAKYGQSKKYDFLSSGSIWNEPRDWMMGLRKKERTLSSFWPGDGRELSDDLQGIQLEAMAISTEKAMVKLVYEFKNANQCIDWVKSQNDSSL